MNCSKKWKSTGVIKSDHWVKPGKGKGKGKKGKLNELAEEPSCWDWSDWSSVGWHSEAWPEDPSWLDDARESAWQGQFERGWKKLVRTVGKQPTGKQPIGVMVMAVAKRVPTPWLVVCC